MVMNIFVLVTLAFASPALIASSSFNGPRKVGTLQSSILREISGIARSTNNDVFWVNNDSGDSNRIYAVRKTGELQATVVLKGAEARDYEDIASGPGPRSGKTYIYVGDFGDNGRSRGSYQIYRFLEPDASNDSSVSVEKINFVYPDGKHDCEALLLDPLTKDLYVVIKSGSGVYRAAYPQDTGKTITLEKLGGFSQIRTVTGGDISSDGTEILLKNYDTVLYWKRAPGESVMSALKRSGKQLKYNKEGQGEAIGWDMRGTGFYTFSEGKSSPIYYYQRQ
jgi:hypothetical protein